VARGAKHNSEDNKNTKTKNRGQEYYKPEEIDLLLVFKTSFISG